MSAVRSLSGGKRTCRTGLPRSQFGSKRTLLKLTALLLDAPRLLTLGCSATSDGETKMTKLAIVATIKTVPGKRDEYLKHLKAHG